AERTTTDRGQLNRPRFLQRRDIRRVDLFQRRVAGGGEVAIVVRPVAVGDLLLIAATGLRGQRDADRENTCDGWLREHQCVLRVLVGSAYAMYAPSPGCMNGLLLMRKA